MNSSCLLEKKHLSSSDPQDTWKEEKHVNMVFLFNYFSFFNGLGLEVMHDLLLSQERRVHFPHASGSQEDEQLENSKETGFAGALQR